MTAPFLDDRDAVRALLQADARALAVLCAPGGRASRSEWRAPNPFRGETGGSGSFCIYLEGEAAGGWKEFDAGDTEKGDVFDLIIRAPATPCTDFQSAMAWARERYNLPGPKSVAEMSPADRAAHEARVAEARAKAEAAAKDAEVRAAERDLEKIGWAQSLWSRGRELRVGDPAYAYLTAPRDEGGRGCAHETVLAAGFRTLDRLSHNPPGGGDKTKWPALLCQATDASGALRGVHRIYVRPDTPGKAPVSPARMYLGVGRGAMIVVSAPEGAREDILCEGVEDGLHLAAARPSARVIATISLAGLQSFELPLWGGPVQRRILVPDNDWKGGPADAAYQAAKARLVRLGLEAGTETREARVPVGKDPDDFVNRRKP